MQQVSLGRIFILRISSLGVFGWGTAHVLMLLLAVLHADLPLWAENQDTPRVLGTAQSDEEFQAYQEVLKGKTPEEVVRNAEEFLKRYPNSGLTAYVRQGAVLAYDQLNDRERLIGHGEAVLQDLPENVAVLTILARTYADSDQPAKAIARAESALRAFARMPRPSTMSESEWSMQRKSVETGIHLSLGTAHLTLAIKTPVDQRAQTLEKAVVNLHSALAGDPESDVSSYRLGLAYLLKNDRENAAKYLAWAVALGGRLASVARTKLEQVCQAQANSQSIELLLSKARQEVQLKIREKQDATVRATP